MLKSRNVLLANNRMKAFFSFSFFFFFFFSGRCNDSQVLSELVYSASRLMILMNDMILQQAVRIVPKVVSLMYSISSHFIIIMMMSCRQHGYPWPSLATSPYRSSPLAGLQGYIPYPHRAAVCRFLLVVLLLLCHMWGSIGVHHLWARPCFSSSVLHVWFV